MAEGSYITIFEAGEGLYEEKKSRFLGFIFHVTSEDEVNEILLPMRKKYWDARHVCYAYVLGADSGKQKFSDDGEPSGTAGKPILDVLTGRNLSDCVAIVVRYFGGVLLGTGGLVRAYHEATVEALADATTIEMFTGRIFTVRADYTLYGKLAYFLNKENIPVLSTDFSDTVTVTFPVPEEDCARLTSAITDMSSGTAPEAGPPISFGITGDCKVIIN